MIFLYEYHRKRMEYEKYFPCIVFGSFLDRNSLLFARLLTQTYGEKRFLLVFFPISRKYGLNMNLKRLLGDLLTNAIFNNGIEEKINEIIITAQKRIEETQIEMQLKNLQNNVKLCTIYQQNSFLFGKLAAQYLQNVIKFPIIVIKNQIYNGIPLNFSIDQFIQSCIYPELELQNVINNPS